MRLVPVTALLIVELALEWKHLDDYTRSLAQLMDSDEDDDLIREFTIHAGYLENARYVLRAALDTWEAAHSKETN